MYMVYTFNTHHTIKCVITIFIGIQWNETVMRHIIIHWSWGKIGAIYIHWIPFLIFLEGSLSARRGYSLEYPPYPLGYRHYSQSAALPLLSDECTTMQTGSSLGEVSRGGLGLLITHRDNAYEHAILEFGILELQREAILRCKSLASASMSKGHPIEPGRNGSFLCLLFPCPLATLSHEESFFSKVTMEARET